MKLPPWAWLELCQAEYVGRVFALLAADPDSEPVPVPAGWGKPLAEWIKRAETGNLKPESDKEFLARMEALASEIPELIGEMDMEALTDVLEAGMGGAAVEGAQNALAKARGAERMAEGAKGREQALATFAVEAPGIVFAPLIEAVAKLDRRTPVAAKLSSAEWADVALALRERAQFSARVESVRFLAEAQARVRQRLALEKEQLANGKSAFVDRSAFIADLRAIAAEEGLNTAAPDKMGTVRDIRSAKRLGLIWDMQTTQAAEYARWKMDQDPDVMDAYPAQRFVRVEAREHPREDWPQRWQAAGAGVGWRGASQDEMVALKASPIWAELSVFGTPWPPFDYGSGMGLEDVSRAEAEELGLLEPGQDVPAGPEWSGGEEGFNATLAASVEGLSLNDVAGLMDQFGDQLGFDRQKHRVVWEGNLIGDLYERVTREGPGGAKHGTRINLGRATPRAVERARPFLDLSGKRMHVHWDDIVKMLKVHGEEPHADQRPLNRLDFEVLPHVWRDPDDAYRGDKAGSVVLRKRVLGRTYLVAWQMHAGEAVVWPNTMWVKDE